MLTCRTLIAYHDFHAGSARFPLYTGNTHFPPARGHGRSGMGGIQGFLEACGRAENLIYAA